MSTKKRSDSSLQHRQQLRKDYVVLPGVVNTVAFDKYVKCLKTILDEAKEQYQKRELDSAYINYVKFSEFFFKLQSHADFKSSRNARTIQLLNQATRVALEHLENIAQAMDEDQDLQAKMREAEDLADMFDEDDGSETSSKADAVEALMTVNDDLWKQPVSAIPLIASPANTTPCDSLASTPSQTGEDELWKSLHNLSIAPPPQPTPCSSGGLPPGSGALAVDIGGGATRRLSVDGSEDEDIPPSRGSDSGGAIPIASAQQPTRMDSIESNESSAPPSPSIFFAGHLTSPTAATAATAIGAVGLGVGIDLLPPALSSSSSSSSSITSPRVFTPSAIPMAPTAPPIMPVSSSMQSHPQSQPQPQPQFQPQAQAQPLPPPQPLPVTRQQIISPTASVRPTLPPSSSFNNLNFNNNNTSSSNVNNVPHPIRGGYNPNPNANPARPVTVNNPPPSSVNNTNVMNINPPEPPPVDRFLGMTQTDVEILRRLKTCFNRFPCPPPSLVTISLRIGARQYRLLKHDFHVSFTPFMPHLPPDLQLSKSAMETNRCFFLHLGIAVQMHPFILEVVFRHLSAARQQRSAADDFCRDILSTVNQYSGFVDANCLCFLWPREFNGARICFVSGSMDAPMFSCFYAKGVSITRDIIIHCSGSHFTLLASGVVNDQILSRMLADAKASGLVVQMNEIDSTTCPHQPSIVATLNRIVSSS